MPRRPRPWALLAFQGNGNTPHSGRYKKNVELGIKYLLNVQGPDGNFYQGNRQEWLYTQGQCTIVICELFGMTKDSHLRLPAEKAVKFCVEAQDTLGGWRYRPKIDSDTSVTGWIVMALQSARMAGLDVPAETLDRVGGYLDKASNDGSLYAYQPGHHPDHVMTAEPCSADNTWVGINTIRSSWRGSNISAAICPIGSIATSTIGITARRSCITWGARTGNAGTIRCATCWSSIKREVAPTREAGTRRAKALTPGPCAIREAAVCDLPVALYARGLLPPSTDLW